MGEETTKLNGRTPNICIIGAGFSGLTAGIQLKRKLNLSSFTIFDENHGIGGTWLLNTYPGAACDVPSHYYSWSFELNPDWSEVYSSSSDILSYMEKITRKYDLYPHINLNTEVKSTVWNECSKDWCVTIFSKETKVEQTLTFDIVITGTGYLRVPNIPTEFEAFTGKILHSANWDPSIDLSRKVVGIIGSGSSAIQIIPEIAPFVSELHSYQRKPPHVMARFQHKYSEFWKFTCTYFWPFMWLVRVIMFLVHESFYLSFFENTLFHRIATMLCKGHMKGQIKDPDLQKKLTPTFPFGCKRVIFHDEYYLALARPNVMVHREKIHLENDKIICADGTETKLDASF